MLSAAVVAMFLVILVIGFLQWGSESEVRCCRICERMGIVVPGKTDEGWYESTLCMECATLKAALKDPFGPQAQELRRDADR
jgi:hypothetical protein